MSTKVMEVSLSKVFLDNENPRHEPIDNEPEIIATLVKSERVLPLARNISQRGLSPLDRIGVVAHPHTRGAYVVAEGNRRACAMKLLSDPEKAPNARLRAEFEALKSKGAFKVPSKIEVVVFESDEEARPWKATRHEGEQGGVGTRKWDAVQKARHSHQGEKTNPNLLALQLIDYAKRGQLISEEDASQIAITTITRYLSNPVLRHTLGLTSPREFLIDVPQDQFDRAVQRFLHDAIPPKDPTKEPKVHSRSDATSRKAYAAELNRSGASPKARLDAAVAPTPSKASAAPRNNRNPDKRTSVIDPSFRCVIKNKILKRLYDELRDIDPGKYSFAAAYLLRAFLEHLSKIYAKDHGLGHDAELHVVIGRCADHIEKDQNLIAAHGAGPLKNIIKPLRVMANEKHSRLSPETLGAWVHGNEIPSGAEIIRRWDTYESAVRILVDGLKNR